MAIKKTPQDFVVDEILTDQWREKIGNKPGPFAIYRLQKTSVTTPQALTEFSKQLGIKPGSANYAGLKDKHGVTSQHVTFDASSKRQRIPGDLAGANWTAKRLGYVDQRIDASAIEGNRFDLVIRTLTRRALDEINTQVERLTSGEQPCSLLTPNYFGNQRFGSLRSNDDFIAKHLIRGEFEQALKLAIGIADRKDDKRTKAFKRAVGENWGNWDRILSEPMRLPERAAIEHLGSNPADFRNAFAKLPYFLQQIWVDAFQSWIWNETAAGLLADRCESAAESMHVVNDMYNLSLIHI